MTKPLFRFTGTARSTKYEGGFDLMGNKVYGPPVQVALVSGNTVEAYDKAVSVLELLPDDEYWSVGWTSVIEVE